MRGCGAITLQTDIYSHDVDCVSISLIFMLTECDLILTFSSRLLSCMIACCIHDRVGPRCSIICYVHFHHGWLVHCRTWLLGQQVWTRIKSASPVSCHIANYWNTCTTSRQCYAFFVVFLLYNVQLQLLAYSCFPTMLKNETKHTGTSVSVAWPAWIIV